MSINSYQDLRVWQLGMELVERVYLATQAFPSEERYGLTNQLRRAAVSIPSNIAEGHASEYRKEYLRGISVAQGSLAEVETQVQIGARLGYMSDAKKDEILALLGSLRRQLYSLRNSLQNKGEAPGSGPAPGPRPLTPGPLSK